MYSSSSSPAHGPWPASSSRRRPSWWCERSCRAGCVEIGHWPGSSSRGHVSPCRRRALSARGSRRPGLIRDGVIGSGCMRFSCERWCGRRLLVRVGGGHLRARTAVFHTCLEVSREVQLRDHRLAPETVVAVGGIQKAPVVPLVLVELDGGTGPFLTHARSRPVS